MTTGLILEGVSGSGKTQTLQALQAHPSFPTLLQHGRIYTEEETFGEFMLELTNPTLKPSQLCIRLSRVLQDLQQALSAFPHSYAYLLERFHPSYYALLPDWSLYEAIDHTLESLNCHIVLLHFRPDQMSWRTLERTDHPQLQDLIDYFGSREQALQAIHLSQQRRQTCLSLSRLPYLEIDTTPMEWAVYADQIVNFWQAATREIPRDGQRDAPIK